MSAVIDLQLTFVVSVNLSENWTDKKFKTSVEMRS